MSIRTSRRECETSNRGVEFPVNLRSKAGGVSASAGGAPVYDNQFESSSEAQRWPEYWRSWSQGRAGYNSPALASHHFKEGM